MGHDVYPQARARINRKAQQQSSHGCTASMPPPLPCLNALSEEPWDAMGTNQRTPARNPCDTGVCRAKL